MEFDLDEIVTEKVTLKYFEKSMNNFDKENLKDFVADSENDILYKNVLKNYEVNHTDTIKDYNFTIDEYELFGNGKYQWYFNYYKTPTCDVNYEGRYMNYLIKTTTKIKYTSGEVIEKKGQGLVVLWTALFELIF